MDQEGFRSSMRKLKGSLKKMKCKIDLIFVITVVFARNNLIVVDLVEMYW